VPACAAGGARSTAADGAHRAADGARITAINGARRAVAGELAGRPAELAGRRPAKLAARRPVELGMRRPGRAEQFLFSRERSQLTARASRRTKYTAFDSAKYRAH
jgi:hypothetical protein